MLQEPMLTGLEGGDDATVKVSTMRRWGFVALQGDEVTDPAQDSLADQLIDVDIDAGNEGDGLASCHTCLKVTAPD